MASAEVVTNISSEDESNDDKENDSSYNSDTPGYLKYEDFSHTPLGLETYSDGLQHPIEMRRILTGDLSSEVTVSYKESPEESFRNLSYPKTTKRPATVELYGSPTISVFGSSSNSSSLLPKPPKLLKGGPSNVSSFSQQSAISSWMEDHNSSVSETTMTDYMTSQSSFMPISPRKPGRPSTAAGTFDPETGSVRYTCRLHCGASLASAKGRRKHEKKHCPNFGKVPPPILKGQQSQLRNQLSAGLSGNGQFAHSLFGAFAAAQQSMQRERRVYDCRYCGKILKTYEGRRLHEKLQHVAKQQLQDGSKNDTSLEDNDEISTEDNKQLLIEHLKAAGMDPSCLDDDPGKILNQDGEICTPAIEYGEEEEEEDEEDDYAEPPSSDGIEISHN